MANLITRFTLALVIAAAIIGTAVVMPTFALADCGEDEKYLCEPSLQRPLPEGFDESDFEETTEEETAHISSMKEAVDLTIDAVIRLYEQSSSVLRAQ